MFSKVKCQVISPVLAVLTVKYNAQIKYFLQCNSAVVYPGPEKEWGKKKKKKGKREEGKGEAIIGIPIIGREQEHLETFQQGKF